MDEKKTIKVSLGTTVCIFIIILLIVALGVVYYLGIVKNKQEIVALKDEVNALKSKDHISQSEKIEVKTNNVSNANSKTEVESKNNNTNNSNIDNDVQYDIEVSLSEIENIGNANIDQLKAFYNKYKDKTIKVTGYVSYWGDKYDLGSDYATGVNIGNSKTYETMTYASGVTQDSNVIQKIHNLKNGQKISLVGKLSTSESQPITINLTNIVEE